METSADEGYFEIVRLPGITLSWPRRREAFWGLLWRRYFQDRFVQVVTL